MVMVISVMALMLMLGLVGVYFIRKDQSKNQSKKQSK